MSPAAKGYAYAITTGLCWAALAILLKYTLSFADSGTIVWFRMFVAASLVFIYFLITAKKKAADILLRPPLIGLLAGICLAFNYFGYMKGVELTTATNTQIIIQTGPIMLLFSGVLYFKEKLVGLQWLGILCALLGFCFFNWDQLITSFQNQEQYIAGNIWIFAAAFTWALFASIQKVLVLRGYTPGQFNLLIYVVCAIVLLPLAKPLLILELSFWQIALLTALGVNTIIAYGALSEALRLIPASKVSLIITCNPLITILLMELMLVFGLDFVDPEPLNWQSYLGAFLVVLGVAIAVSLKNASRGRLKRVEEKV